MERDNNGEREMEDPVRPGQLLVFCLFILVPAYEFWKVSLVHDTYRCHHTLGFVPCTHSGIITAVPWAPFLDSSVHLEIIPASWIALLTEGPIP